MNIEEENKTTSDQESIKTGENKTTSDQESIKIDDNNGSIYNDQDLEYYNAEIYNGEVGLTNITFKLFNGNLKYIHQKETLYYLWNDTTLLWENYMKKDALLHPISSLLQPLIKYLLLNPTKKINKINKKLLTLKKNLNKTKDKNEKIDIKNEIEDVKELLKNMEKDLNKLLNIQKNINSKSTLENVLRLLTKKIIDKDFMKNLNSIHKNLLPIMEGLVIDFKTLETRKRTKEDLFSYECKVNFLKNKDDKPFKSIHGKRFIYSMFNNDKESAEYFRKLSGYFLTGETEAKLFTVLLGTQGNNSKSSYINIMSKILGDIFSGSCIKSAIFETRSEAVHNADEIPLLKKRFVHYSETTGSNVIKADTVKKVSGGDGVDIRDCGKGSDGSTKFFNYKLLIATNTIFDFKEKTENIEALMKRLHYIPLLVSFHESPEDVQNKKKGYFYEKADPDFITNLENNQDYIDDFFTYIAQGAHKWYNQINKETEKRIIEIKQPAKIIEAKNIFMKALDKTANFLSLDFDTDIGNKKYYCLRSSMANHYKNYCEDEGIPFKKSDFFKELTKAGYVFDQGSGFSKDHKNYDYNGQMLVYGIRYKLTEEDKKEIALNNKK